MLILPDEYKKKIPVVLTSSYYQEWVNYYRKILIKSRQEKYNTDPLNLIAIQIGLMRSIRGIEGKIFEAKKGLRKARQEGDTKDAEDFERGITLNRAVVRIAKIIADGIAWRTLGYDRPFLRALAEPKKPSGSVQFGTEYQTTEDTAVQMAYERKSKVLLTDITYFLRVGDLIEVTDPRTLIYEIKTKYNPNGSVKNVELITIDRIIKTNKKSLNKQEEKLFQANYLRELRKIPLPNSQAEIYIFDVPIKYKTNLRSIEELINLAKKDVFATRTFGNYLTVSCTDIQLFHKKHRKDASEAMEQYKENNPWDKSDIVLPMSNLDIFYEEDGDFVRNSTPYSVFPFSSINCMRIMSGDLWLTSRLNITEIMRLFRAHGWTVTEIDWLKGDKSGQRGSVYYDDLESTIGKHDIFSISGKNFQTNISLAWLHWISSNFMRPETLIEMVEYISTHPPRTRPQYIESYILGEKNVWK